MPWLFTPGDRAPGTHWTANWLYSRIGLGDVERRKILTLPEFQLQPSAAKPVYSHVAIIHSQTRVCGVHLLHLHHYRYHIVLLLLPFSIFYDRPMRSKAYRLWSLAILFIDVWYVALDGGSVLHKAST